MSLAAHLARQIARPLARPIVRAPQYDADAATWFSAVEAAGGLLSSSGYDAGYTKAALSAFFAELKAQGLWTAITELGIIGVGVGNLTAALQKAKYASIATLTNNNFVNGDLTPNGAGTGLKGNGSSKYLSTGVSANALSQNSASLWVYVTNPVISGSTQGLLDNGFRTQLFAAATTGSVSAKCNSVTNTATAVVMTKGLVGFSRTGSTAMNWRVNDTTGTDATASAPGGAGTLSVFSQFSSNNSPSALALYGFGTAIDLAKLETACDNLMSSFGFAP